MSDKAVVSFSGGLDSTSCLAYAVHEHGAENVTAVSFNYGQKHTVELECARDVANHFHVDHRIITLPRIFGDAGSTLVEGGGETPHMTYKEIEETQGVSPTYVPFRNANLISMATTVAVSLVEGTEDHAFVYAGVHSEDARNWAYPDCSPEFIGAMANAIYVGTYGKVRLVTPLEWMMKKDVVMFGLKYGAPFALTHSCYEGQRPACGLCPTCVERIEAFKSNGLCDPIQYVIPVDWESK